MSSQSSSTVTFNALAMRMAVITFGRLIPRSIALISGLDIFALLATSLWLIVWYSR